jgi:hypothetical protein
MTRRDLIASILAVPAALASAQRGEGLGRIGGSGRE